MSASLVCSLHNQLVALRILCRKTCAEAYFGVEYLMSEKSRHRSFSAGTFLLYVLFSWMGAHMACAAAEHPVYKTYANDRYGYSISYPDIFWSRFEADNGDGVRLKTANGQCELAVWGEFNIFDQDARTRLQSTLEQKAHIVPGSAASGKGWYTVTCTDDGGMNGVEHHFLEYGIVTPDKIAVFTFSYPLGQGFENIAGQLRNSLQLGNRPGETLQQFNLHDWNPEYALDPDEEKVYRIQGETRQYAGTPTQTSCDMGTYYWFPVSPEQSTVLRGSRRGIYFFSETGAFISFLPCNAAEYAGEVRVSPTAGQLLIDFGTAPERKLELYDFRTLRQKRVFDAMEKIVWLDDQHFAMTFIDQSEESRPGNALESGWLSVAVYDTVAKKLDYVRKATPTSNFLLDSVDRQTMSFSIGERWVRQPADWTDEEKIGARQLAVRLQPQTAVPVSGN